MFASRFLVGAYCAFYLGVLPAWGQADEPLLSTDDRLFQAEAEINSLKSQLAATNSLVAQERPNAFNPSISVVGDVVGQYGFNMEEKSHKHDEGHEGHNHDHEKSFANGVMIREVEFEFRGELPYADALVAFALEPKDFHHVDVHLEEAYARLKKWPGLGFAPLGMMIKAGKFRTAIGRMNRIHQHNIPQMSYPMAMSRFLGDEGYAGTGLSVDFSVNPGKTTALSFFIEGVFNSKMPIQKKGAEEIPTGIAHVWLHQELAPSHFLDLGVSNAVGRKGKEQSGTFWLLGSDLHYSYVPTGYGPNALFLFGNEFFTANQTKGQGRWPLGNFTWAQVMLFNSTFFGVLYDLAPKDEHHLLDFQHALGGYLTHYTTEFLRFRLGYEHVMPKLASFDGDHRLMLSMIFIVGSHPVEPYFINR